MAHVLRDGGESSVERYGNVLLKVDSTIAEFLEGSLLLELCNWMLAIRHCPFHAFV